MKPKTDSTVRPGALAAAVLFHSDPERPAALKVQHRPGCASERGEVCDCCATLERAKRQEEATP